jgi:CAI-1 autoinducer synthase
VQSGVFHLNQHPTHTLEMALAGWVGKDDGFICQSGYTANVGLLQAIADAQTPVYLDSLAHASLWEGAHAARAPAFAFRHNDPAPGAHDRPDGPGIVVVDSVYSTTGAVCPLVEIVEVAEQHGCMILVDESHSLGTHGPQGAGLCAELGLTTGCTSSPPAWPRPSRAAPAFSPRRRHALLHPVFTASPTSSAPACCRTRSPAWRPRWR